MHKQLSIISPFKSHIQNILEYFIMKWKGGNDGLNKLAELEE